MISIIVAVDKNKLIGNGNELPWSFPEDLKYFQEQTVGKFVIMGEKTFLSIKKPLKRRKIVVLSHKKDISFEGASVANSLEEALLLTKGEVMVAGGRSVYEQFLKIADRIYLTVIDDEFKGDVYFPDFNEEEWSITEKKRGKNTLLTFQILDRKN